VNTGAAAIVIVAGAALAAFAAGSETAVVACSKVRLHARARAGSQRARILERLIASPEYFFSVVLVATNLAVVACTAAATALAVAALGRSGAPVATVVTVPLLLLVGEVIPKSVFLYHADRVSIVVAPFLEFLSYVLWPIAMPTTLLARSLLRITGGRPKRFNILSTREELVYLYRSGKKEGALEQRDRLIIDRVFQFGGVRARDLAVPMAQVVSFPVTASVDEVVAAVNRYTYANYPIVSPADGGVVGVISLFDLLGLDGGERLASVMHEPFFVKESEPAERLFVKMKDGAIHLAIVVGERGEPRGIVTLEDLLASIVGDVLHDYPPRSTGSASGDER
jgi:putative hemolysin